MLADKNTFSFITYLMSTDEETAAILINTSTKTS